MITNSLKKHHGLCVILKLIIGHNKADNNLQAHMPAF